MHSQPYVKHTHMAFPPHPCPHPRTLTQTPRTALRPFGNPHHLSRAPTSALPIWATKTHKLRPHRVTTCCVVIVYYLLYTTSSITHIVLTQHAQMPNPIPPHSHRPSLALCNTKKGGQPLTAAAYLILQPKRAPTRRTGLYAYISTN